MIGLQDETNRCSTKVLHVHILSSPIPRKMLHKICRICKIYWCKWDETSSSIPSWTLRSKVFGAMTKEHLVSEGVLPMSTLEVPTSGVDGLTYPWKPFLWHSPTVPAIFFWTGQTGGRHPSWQRWRQLGWVVGCGRLCVWGTLKALPSHLEKAVVGVQKVVVAKAGLVGWTFSGCHGKMEYFTVRGRGEEAGTVAEPVDAILEVWFVHFDSCHNFKGALFGSGQQNWTAFLRRSWQEDDGSPKKELQVWFIGTKSKAGMASHVSSWR